MTDDTDTVEIEVPEQAQAEAQVEEKNPAVLQTEMPFALVQGLPMTTIPEDLYIPPDALEVILEAFEGPLDLLLYLIRRQNLDILDIPIAAITKQYMTYIDLMQEFRLELAAEYLVMAAMLAEIKSRLLLPKPKHADEEEEDPRAELIRRLQEYEVFKKAAEELDEYPRQERDLFNLRTQLPELKMERPLPELNMDELIHAFSDVLRRADMNSHHHIQREPLSIRERMTEVLSRLRNASFASFESLFSPKEGRMGVVVTFIAILELMKQSMIEIVQNEAYSPIHVKAVS